MKRRSDSRCDVPAGRAGGARMQTSFRKYSNIYFRQRPPLPRRKSTKLAADSCHLAEALRSVLSSSGLKCFSPDRVL